eukprot:CAMPEP_0172213222 /NCGR_PEP_ID=MMETSP1050-20130122/37467_1 /TAXON_ID=233186 /ORGANISM="Cryptomonas curvata, Strain CCAP979/52" /LENGTH=550 /DNA_ID=CAMNT_0012894019 /DNA_START=489 /DNA_END=2142 /DNA_ORIENTATION=+
MYDSVAEFIETHAPGAKLERSANKSRFTPRILAAAEGSCKMFIHLFDDKLETAWSYGPLKCLKMFLDDVEDVDEEMFDDLNPQRPTILATLVNKQRKDVFSSSQIERLVNVKWVKYGRGVFQRKFLLTGLFTVLIFFLPMIQFQTSIIGYCLHFLSHIFAVYISEHICVKKVENSILLKWVFGLKDAENGYYDTIREFTAWVYGCFFNRPDFGKWFAGIKKGLSEGDLDLIFYALAPLCLKLLTVLFVCRIWIAPQAESDCDHVAFACRLGLFVYYRLPLLGELPKADFAQVDLTLAAVFVFSVASRISFGPVSDLAVGILEAMECWLYFLVGVLSFSIGISDITVLEKFGAFVFSLIKITNSDLPIFFTIYGAFLILFAHAHYLGSNKLHAGIQEGIDSIWRIFQAMLGQFYDPAVDDQASSCPATMDYATTTDHAQTSTLSPITRCMVTSISVTNYFLVSVVLINVLIAMLSNSYQQCKDEAKSLWKLHRASIIVKIDLRMSSAQRNDASKVFWHTSPGTAGKKIRFLTFTTVDRAVANNSCMPAPSM